MYQGLSGKAPGGGAFFFASLVSDPKYLLSQNFSKFPIREQIFEYSNVTNGCQEDVYLLFLGVFMVIFKNWWLPDLVLFKQFKEFMFILNWFFEDVSK